jgi:hypothetical protein
MLNVSLVFGFLLCLVYSAFVPQLEAAELVLPDAAQRVVAKMDSAVQDAHIAAVKDLTAIKDRLTKAGDLDGALAVRGKITELQAQIGDVLSGPKPAKKPSLAALEGRWSRLNNGNGNVDVYEFDANGSGSGRGDSCTITVSSDGKSAVQRWRSGYVDTLDLPVSGDQTFTGKSATGATFVYTKMK